MNLKDLSDHYGICRLDDWAGLKRDGSADMADIVNQWQDQALAANHVAVAPGNSRIRLNSKVTFKVPTSGIHGQQTPSSGGTRGQPTTFVNGGINDGSWMIEIANGVGETYNFLELSNFRIFNNAALYTCAGMRNIGALGSGAMQSWTWRKLIAYGFTVNLESFGFNGVLDQIVSRQASITCFRAYQANALKVLGGWYGSGKTGGSDFELIGDRDSQGFCANISFDNTVFQPESITGISHGLRISEGVSDVRINAYFESHRGNSSTKAWALDVGSFKAQHASGSIPTALSFDGTSFTGANAPTYEESKAVQGITVQNSVVGGGGGATNAEKGPRLRFDNVHGIDGDASGLGAKEILFTKYSRDIDMFPRGNYTNSVVSDSHLNARSYASEVVIKDELNRLGQPIINIMPPGDFVGSDANALRTMEVSSKSGGTTAGYVSWDSDATVTYDGKPTLKIIRTGNSLAGEATLFAIPYGSTSVSIPEDAYITLSGMIRVKSAGGYATNPTGSSNATLAYPGLGLYFEDAGGPRILTLPTGAAGADGFVGHTPDQWSPFFFWFKVTTGGLVTRLGFAASPIYQGASYVPVVAHQINLAKLAICVNPMSFRDVRKGRYSHSPRAGFFMGDKFHVTATVPGGADVNLQQGDVFWNPAPAAAGAVPAWQVIITGNGATALNHCPMAVLGAAI